MHDLVNLCRRILYDFANYASDAYLVPSSRRTNRYGVIYETASGVARRNPPPPMRGISAIGLVAHVYA
jgi:hypothetical protein